METETRNEEVQKARCELPGIRYLFAFMGFLGFCTIYAIRVNINVAIVAMVNDSAIYKNDNETRSEECNVTPPPLIANHSSYDLPKEGEFIWSTHLQAVILGSFYYGYCISQIPGGRMAEIFSAKWIFGIGTGITALLTLLTPIAARCHVALLIVIRTLEGLSQGVTMPAMHSMLGRWVPDCEKAFLSTVVYCGICIGTVVTMPLSGYLCNTEFLGGWPSAFYMVGIFGCVWFIFWALLVTDNPSSHPWITKKELKYITLNQRIEQNVELPQIPWMKIATSVPFWALIITQIGQDWCFYTIVNDLPTFFATVLHFKIETNGFLSSFPYLLQTIVGCTVGYLADLTIRKKFASPGFVRKFCNTAAGLGTAAGLVGVCLAGCDVTMNVVFFTCSLAIGGFCYSGYMVSHLDLSPEYAGTLMGIANTISNLTGFLAPSVVGALTENSPTLHQWRIVFFITVIILIVTTLVFVFFSSAEKQPWSPDVHQYEILNSIENPQNIQVRYGTMMDKS
ncbi:sialin-like isoform X1 [Stegodyphus dumicola]|uniref:sialin-like isoform X1 n=1 Tax=Stegodyphus dumicola TaxID=202533 RepID=UPI0015AF12AE|nr:sialin-like isoform X1 [Stegodyphus dumicola]XP_035231491.1 sialin-like isoform X1 [Stegodyphus dumicola]